MYGYHLPSPAFFTALWVVATVRASLIYFTVHMEKAEILISYKVHNSSCLISASTHKNMKINLCLSLSCWWLCNLLHRKMKTIQHHIMVLYPWINTAPFLGEVIKKKGIRKAKYKIKYSYMSKISLAPLRKRKTLPKTWKHFCF